MADRGRDREAIRNIGDSSRREAMKPQNTESERPSAPTDAGKTSGGGSLGHDQPPRDQNHIRNEGSQGRGDLRDREPPDPLPELEP